MNMKKMLLITLLATAVSTRVFADFGLGVIGGVDINTTATWRIGATLGMGSQTGHPFFINLLFNGSSNFFSIKPTFDWHALTWNISIVQLYLGLGAGTEFEFGTSDYDDDPFTFTLAARIPVGVKIFLNTFEWFLEASPEFGWRNYSHNIASNNNKREDTNSFHWDIGLYTGFRFWF